MHNFVSVDETKTVVGVLNDQKRVELSVQDDVIDKDFKFSKKAKIGA